MDERLKENARVVAAKAEVPEETKKHVKQHGVSMMHLLARAQRMQDEITREIDFHDFNAVPWDAEKPKWGQKKWKSKVDCKYDVERMRSAHARIVEAANRCDKKMRLDVPFEDLCQEMEALALELEGIADAAD